jgi:hypothetical protein
MQDKLLMEQASRIATLEEARSESNSNQSQKQRYANAGEFGCQGFYNFLKLKTLLVTCKPVDLTI